MTRVLVTGGAGLLGSYVRQRLAGFYDCVSFDLAMPQDGSEGVVGSIMDLDALTTTSDGVDAVLHIAAAANINSGTHAEIIQANAVGSWNVLEAANRSNVRRVVLCSTDSTLGNTVWPEHFWRPHYLPVDEAHPLRPSDPYGLSKLMAEEAGRSFAARSKLEVLALRPVFILFPSMMGEVAARHFDPERYVPGQAGGHAAAGGGLCWHHIDPRDVANAFFAAIDSPYCGFESFYLAAEETLHPLPTLEILSKRFGDLPRLVEPDRFAKKPYASMFSTEAAASRLSWHPEFNHRSKLYE